MGPGYLWGHKTLMMALLSGSKETMSRSSLASPWSVSSLTSPCSMRTETFLLDSEALSEIHEERQSVVEVLVN